MLEIVMFDLKDLVSSLKLLICDAENRLEFVFSRLIRALRAHSLKLNSGSSLRRDCSVVEAMESAMTRLDPNALQYSSVHQPLNLVSFRSVQLYIKSSPHHQNISRTSIMNFVSFLI